jgi:hypothetical protein
MSKYDKYLERGIQKIKSLERRIDSVRPAEGARGLANMYLKEAEMAKYFSKYRDKGSGLENYRAFLSARGKYFQGSRGNFKSKGEREENAIKTLRKRVMAMGRKQWNRDD